MSKLNHNDLEPIFHPRSIAFAGISLTNPNHWTTVFFKSVVELAFEGPIYLVNPRGGKSGAYKVYRSISDIPSTVDYVVSTVGASTGPDLVKECANKGVKAIHFCTAGFSETGEEEGIDLEAQLLKAARETGIRIVGPNCMGIYCPKSRLSFAIDFPKQSGPVGLLSQSGGNATSIVRQAASRGVRFSKVVSYGNACDLNESDFLEYLTNDPDTTVIALYIEGIKNGKRFHRALEAAAKDKTVVLLKAGIGEGGARAVTGHTGALAGNEIIWDSLCRQLGVIQVFSIGELVDMLETLLFMPMPRGKNCALIGAGGGNSVLIADEFERRGLKLPSLPGELRQRMRKFSPAAGNIFRNPIDYSQTFMEADKLGEVVEMLSQWEGVDFLIGFLDLSGFAMGSTFDQWTNGVEGMLQAMKRSPKPMAMVLQLGTVPEDAKQIFELSQKFVQAQLPIYLSFSGAANSISLMLTYKEHRAK